MRFNLLVPVLFSLLSSSALALTSAELYSKGAKFSQLKISPNGEFISVKLKDDDGRQKLLILETETLKMSHAVSFGGNKQVGDYEWVNDERIVLAKEYLKGWSDHPLYYGELMAVNADGSKPLYLVGYEANGGVNAGSRIQKGAEPLRATAWILDPLVNDDKKMLIHALPWGGGNNLDTERLQQVYSVDVYRGKRKQLFTTPIAMPEFLVDDEGEVRFIGGLDRHDDKQIFVKKDDKWVNLETIGLGGYTPISLTNDPNVIYAAGTEHGEPTSVFKLDIKTGERQLVVNDPIVDPLAFWVNPHTKSLYAVEFEKGYPNYAFVNIDDENTKLLKDLLAALPGYQVRIASETRDSNKKIIFAFNDRTPGKYFLFNTQNNQLRLLLDVMEGINPDLMAEVKPMPVTVRDGKEIQTYLTLPNDKKAEKLPLVVNPHGGPHGPRDYWEFDPQNQFLASQGYAVLQVNYRGSGGFGLAFEHAGYKKWGSDIQYDIIDATQSLIDQGIVDKDKICIVGTSFGGYSALMSAELAPDMFKCAVGIAGVYNLPMMFNEGDVQDTDYGTSYLKKVLGEDPQTLLSMSPTQNVGKLKAELFLVHGGNDERAPIEQLYALEDALKKIDYPYQELIMDDEGHGFYDTKHRAILYQKMADFLKKHLN
ncbi:S9 family peptidase [Shewanella avicenniae]|uniref:S9 family peptidase n=1 Tax=Shewanella avicenniae TaxID=2814294 RepID=A0ABX7QTG0_9GAMM|nr:alpha/beta fold hydrolase [Shewanella avicenniae]QSX33966.1 S9 family peptidase [Shewanella avicenniae]